MFKSICISNFHQQHIYKDRIYIISIVEDQKKVDTLPYDRTVIGRGRALEHFFNTDMQISTFQIQISAFKYRYLY